MTTTRTERATQALDAVFSEEKSIWVEMSAQDATTLKMTLDYIFCAVRSGKVDAVREVTGISNMLDAAHLVSVRKTLGE